MREAFDGSPMTSATKYDIPIVDVSPLIDRTLPGTATSRVPSGSVVKSPRPAIRSDFSTRLATVSQPK